MLEVSPGQLALVAVAAAQYSVATVASIVRSRKGSASAGKLARFSFWLGGALSVIVLIWHCASMNTWLPLADNFTALLWLALLLALFLAYLQRTRPLIALNGFVLPIVVVLLLGAGILGRTRPHYYVATTWSGIHLVTAYCGFAAFAIAGATGLMYLIASYRLRIKHKLPNPNLGSLERLESMTRQSVRVGFALLTIGLLTGLALILSRSTNALGPHWFTSPKVILTFCVWIIYALVLHSPIRFRGRQAAMLSVLGFLLMIGTLIAVNLPVGAMH